MGVNRCPICATPVDPVSAGKLAPFCSERCRLIDLGAWLNGSYTVPCAPSEDDDQDGFTPIKHDSETDA